MHDRYLLLAKGGIHTQADGAEHGHNALGLCAVDRKNIGAFVNYSGGQLG